MKTSIFSKFVVLLLMMMTLIAVSCKKTISKEDLEYQVGQAISDYFYDETIKQYGSLISRERIFEIQRFETKVSLIKETENSYIGDVIVESWTPDQHGGDGPGTKDGEQKFAVAVTVDTDDGSFRWEIR